MVDSIDIPDFPPDGIDLGDAEKLLSQNQDKVRALTNEEGEKVALAIKDS